MNSSPFPALFKGGPGSGHFGHGGRKGKRGGSLPKNPPSALGQAQGLFDKPAIPVTSISGKEISSSIAIWQARQSVREYARQFKGKTYHNSDTGWPVEIGKEGFHKLFGGVDKSLADFQSVAALPALLERAVLAETHEDRKGEEQLASIHRFYAPLVIGGTLYRVKITVKDYKEGKKRHHALSTAEVEATPAVYHTRLVQSEDRLPGGRPTGAPGLSIDELLRCATGLGGLPPSLES